MINLSGYKLYSQKRKIDSSVDYWLVNKERETGIPLIICIEDYCLYGQIKSAQKISLSGLEPIEKADGPPELIIFFSNTRMLYSLKEEAFVYDEDNASLTPEQFSDLYRQNAYDRLYKDTKKQKKEFEKLQADFEKLGQEKIALENQLSRLEDLLKENLPTQNSNETVKEKLPGEFITQEDIRAGDILWVREDDKWKQKVVIKGAPDIFLRTSNFFDPLRKMPNDAEFRLLNRNTLPALAAGQKWKIRDGRIVTLQASVIGGEKDFFEGRLDNTIYYFRSHFHAFAYADLVELIEDAPKQEEPAAPEVVQEEPKPLPPLAVGQTWRQRNGEIITIVLNDGSEIPFKDNGGFWRRTHKAETSKRYDLVELISDGPSKNNE